MNEKSVSRLHLLTKRRQIPPRSAMNWSNAIAFRLYDCTLYKNCDLLLTFVGSKDNEVNTLPIVQYSLSLQKQVLLPIIVPKQKMAWCECSDINTLQRNQWDILEPPHPQSNQMVVFSTSTCCLVPGIAFSHAGHRIGYGGGYFDRFLADFSGVSIGLCYEVMLLKNLPIESHDLAVDWIITESRCIKCTPMKNSSD